MPGLQNVAADPARAILLVADDDVFCEQLAKHLRRRRMSLKRGWLFGDAIVLAANMPFDAVLIGHMIHGRDVQRALPHLREVYPGPIIVIADDIANVDVSALRQAGADEVVDKRRGACESMAEVLAVQRRRRRRKAALGSPIASPAQGNTRHASPQMGTVPVATVPSPVMLRAISTTGQMPEEGRWRMSHARREIISPDGAVLRLTSPVFDVLAYLAHRRGQLVSRKELLVAYGGRPKHERSRTTDGMVSQLRILLAPHLHGRSPIASVRGRGYVFIGFDAIDADRPSVHHHGSELPPRPCPNARWRTIANQQCSND